MNSHIITYAVGSIHGPSVASSPLTETLVASALRDVTKHTCNDADHRCKDTCNHYSSHPQSSTV